MAVARPACLQASGSSCPRGLWCTHGFLRLRRKPLRLLQGELAVAVLRLWEPWQRVAPCVLLALTGLVGM